MFRDHSLCGVWWFVFLKVLNPLYFGGCNFLISNLFSMIISVSNATRGGVQILFGHPKQGEPSPLDLAYPERLSVQSSTGLP
jgi:hypothetical protein